MRQRKILTPYCEGVLPKETVRKAVKVVIERRGTIITCPHCNNTYHKASDVCPNCFAANTQ